MILLEKTEFLTDLATALALNGIPAFAADTALCEALFTLSCRMLEVGEHMNLTTIKAPRDIILRHYVDSLTAAAHIPAGSTVLDIGCGAGFPSLPLALARPDLHITAIDSTEKKVRYVAETAALLGLPAHRLTARALRAEEGGAPGGELREKFNIVVSRAVAHLSILGELALPCLTVGGTLIALKGARAAEEMAQAKGLSVLGAAPAVLCPAPLVSPWGGETEQHGLVIIEKKGPTPRNYPRKYGVMSKKPL